MYAVPAELIIERTLGEQNEYTKRHPTHAVEVCNTRSVDVTSCIFCSTTKGSEKLLFVLGYNIVCQSDKSFFQSFVIP